MNEIFNLGCITVTRAERKRGLIPVASVHGGRTGFVTEIDGALVRDDGVLHRERERFGMMPATGKLDCQTVRLQYANGPASSIVRPFAYCRRALTRSMPSGSAS